MENNITIYKITNTESGKIYIGQTKNLNERWRVHKYWAKVGRGNAPLHKAIKSYGNEKFVVTVLLAGLSRDEANTREVELISHYKSNSRETGYNVTIGGEGHRGVFGVSHPMYGIRRADLSERNKQQKGKKLSEEHKRKISPVGRKQSDETKKKMSESRKKAWESGVYANTNWMKYTETAD
jgi:group I intron endonuclease